jgi:ketosteroid isomerase-like protein
MADRDEILAAVARFRAAYEAGDVGALADCYSASLLKLRQGGAETKAFEPWTTPTERALG